ncbi:MAG: hypothetical protein Lokiarch_09490 [Candidatus Lokiarchaeum sp. GC14_75]|nr:MAG: hypothetical protein Lokiarch_09490 [Candidatus Lokiarchaeum sp. GC14_75]
MAKVKCHVCGKEIIGGAKIQEFSWKETTTMFVFCSEQHREKWKVAHKKEEEKVDKEKVAKEKADKEKAGKEKKAEKKKKE